MQRLLMSMLLGGAGLAAIAQAAPPAAYEAGGGIVPPAQSVRLFPQDLEAWQGIYTLSNGQTMVLRRNGLRLLAAVAGGPPQALVAAAANEFVAIDQRLKITLVDEGLGGVTGQVVMVVPRQAAQQPNASQGEVVRLAIR